MEHEWKLRNIYIYLKLEYLFFSFWVQGSPEKGPSTSIYESFRYPKATVIIPEP